jgi:hypothetical protein
MKHRHERINELVGEIQKLLKEEIQENCVKYETYILVDFSDKLSELLDELNFSLSD